MKRFAFLAALMFASVACTAPTAETQSEESTGETQQAATSNGFICNGNGCICDPDADNPVDSCDGMAKLCDRVGPGMLCTPGGWCHCIFSNAASVSLPAPPKKVPIGAARATDAGAVKAF